MDRPPSFEQPPIKIKERPQLPIIQSQINTNTSKSKWEIRPPELLSCMVGPDRQVKLEKKNLYFIIYLFVKET